MNVDGCTGNDISGQMIQDTAQIESKESQKNKRNSNLVKIEIMDIDKILAEELNKNKQKVLSVI